MKSLVIIGTNHRLEYKDFDKNELGKEKIYSILNEKKPDIVFIEKGYHEEPYFCPKRDNDMPDIKKHWAYIWCGNNDDRIIQTDLNKKVKNGIRLDEKREKAIARCILDNISKFTSACLFTGKDHVNNIINNILKENNSCCIDLREL